MYIRARTFIAAIFCVLYIQTLMAQISPVPMLQKTADRILADLKTQKGSLTERQKMIQKSVATHLLPHVDVEGMSRSVLGRAAWNKASSSERTQFTHAFTQLVIRTYADPLSQYQGETIDFLPVRGNMDGKFLRISSVIVRPNGKKIPLNYSLVALHHTWKIYDLSVEGVSLLQSFRSQFAQILQQEGMSRLLQQMQVNAHKKT